ncbi:MAG: MFS transporter [Gemmatimonadales bacterium]|nr:MFS transporter [Gemmatimonadales bacterium]
MTATPIAPPAVAARAPQMLALLATALVLALSVWFSASAVAPELRARWQLTAAQAGWLTAAVQLGFVAGTLVAAVTNVADMIPSRRYFATCAAGAALATLACARAPGFGTALGARVVAGIFLAGVYPPALKMAATWFFRDRGFATGVVIAALTLGKGLPYLLHAFPALTADLVLRGAAGAAAAGGLLVLLCYEDGPFAFPRRRFDPALVARLAAVPEVRRITLGYLGHMWELYALWTWLPAWAAASLAGAAVTTTGAPVPRTPLADLLAMLMFVAGAVGCVWGGRRADRIGYLPVARQAMRGSGACALLSGGAFLLPWWALAPFVAAWGFLVIADSGQFSAALTRAAPPDAVGTALTLQTSLGFLLTIVTIQGTGALADTFGWQWALVALALGPLAGAKAVGEGSRREGGPETRG